MSDFQDAFTAGQSAKPVPTIEKLGELDILHGSNVVSLEKYRATPVSKRGSLTFFDESSFAAYVNDHQGEGTRIFADVQKQTMVAVLDHHSVSAPAWGKHRAELATRLTPEWEDWTAADGEPKSQVEFAQFVEDHITEIAEPTGGRVLEIVSKLEIKKDVTFESAVRLDNGQTQLRYHEDVQDRAAGELKIPQCESVERVDPVKAIPGGRLHLLLAGPECTHHSTARGGRPVNDQSRATAWHILKWAQELYIDTILIENVPEFRSWGPIGANNKPLKSKKGQTYRAFLDALRSLNYKVEERILCSADYGDPTTRKRLFIMARRGRHRVSWPTPTHSRTGSPTLFGSTKPWRAAREVIDWDIPGKSIFNRKKPLKPATIARILAGLEKFGGPELQPFLVILRNHADGRSIDRPVPTLAAQGQHVGLCEPFIVPVNHGAEELRSRSVEEPLPTLTGRANQYLVEPFVISAGGANLRRPRGTSEPLPTVMGSDRLAVVEPFVLQQQSGGVPRSTEEPLPTIASVGAISIVQPFIIDAAFGRGDDTRRTSSLDMPLGTIPGSNRFALAEPFLVPMYGERAGQEPRTHTVDEPVPTVPASGSGKCGVVEPFIFANRTHNAPKSIDEPIPPLCTGDHIAVVEPFLTKYNRTATKAYSVNEPIDTISTRDRFGLVQPVVDGYVLDIRFRMLQPHELAAATSFPKSYVFRGSREDVVKQIGNSWTGELSYQLNREVVQDYAPKRARGRRVA